MPASRVGRSAVASQRLWAQDGEQSTLTEVVAAAVGTVPSCDAAGVSLRHTGGRIDTPAWTTDYVKASDAAQYRLGEGPCLDAIREAGVYQIDDISADVRWPEFGQEATRLGIVGVLSIQLFTSEELLGSLNLYATTPHAFGRRSVIIGKLVATHAAVAIAAARDGDQLRVALRTRELIGEAVGILMERHQMSSDSAFQMLKWVSQNHNVKVRELAERVVHTGESFLSE